MLIHYLLGLQPFMLWTSSCGPLLALWVLGFLVVFIKTFLFGKPELYQEAAGASRGTNKTISSKQSTVKACYKFLVADIFSFCVPATPCSTTSTWRPSTLLKGGRNTTSIPRTLSGRQRPQWHQPEPAPAPKIAGEPEPEEPVPSVPLSGVADDSLEELGAAFSGSSVGGPAGKENGKEKEGVDMGIEEEDPGHGHQPSDEVLLDDKPVESAPSASDHPAVPSPTTTTLPATHPATSSPTTTPPMAEGLGFTGMPYSAYGVAPTATAPPMATTVSEPVAFSSTYTGIPESMSRRYDDECHRPATAVYMTGIPAYAAPDPGYTMPAPGFTSLRGLRGPESCCGRSRGLGRSSNKSLTRSEIREGLRGATADLVGDLTQEIRAKLEPLIPPQASPTTMGAFFFFFWAWRSPAEDNALKRPDHGHSKRSWRAEVHRRTAAGIYRLT